LEVWGNVNIFGRELRRGEIRELLEEVGVVRRVHVQVGCRRIARLRPVSRNADCKVRRCSATILGYCAV
jgi:hypothetical protein